MMKHFFFLLFFATLFAGCSKTAEQQAAPLTSALTPVVVDEAAAYPKQEPGTRPSVLTGFKTLTREQLDEGWVQLFDGVSTFGWEVKSGEAKLSVQKRGDDTILHCEKKAGEEVILLHKMGNAKIICETGGRVNCGNEGSGFGLHFDASLNSNVTTVGGTNFETFQESCTIGVRGLPQQSPMEPFTAADWKPAAGASKAVWTDNVLELTGGSGMVETVKEYGDFVLQLEYFTEAGENGKGVNSGVFFRCIPSNNSPSEMMNGYECQIYNNPPAKDYEKFIGTDTGGIFRRCVGRNIGAKDGQWNYLTIVVRGPMMATWVNGIQVTDWKDARREDENPRKGLRLKPGTIQLQGHDPGTKIKFRNMRIAEIKQ